MSRPSWPRPRRPVLVSMSPFVLSSAPSVSASPLPTPAARVSSSSRLPSVPSNPWGVRGSSLHALRPGSLGGFSLSSRISNRKCFQESVKCIDVFIPDFVNEPIDNDMFDEGAANPINDDGPEVACENSDRISLLFESRKVHNLSLQPPASAIGCYPAFHMPMPGALVSATVVSATASLTTFWTAATTTVGILMTVNIERNRTRKSWNSCQQILNTVPKEKQYHRGDCQLKYGVCCCGRIG